MYLPNGHESTLHYLLRSPKSWLLLIIVAGYASLRFRIFSPRYSKLLRRGLDLQLAGEPLEAEKCFRAALNMGAKVPESGRIRILVNLGDALRDQGRYEDAKQCITQALELGDTTGSAQASMCDVLLAQKASPEKAIEMADVAMQGMTRLMNAKSFGSWAKMGKDLYEAKTWARKAQALLLLDQRAEARQAMDRTMSIIDASKSELQQTQPESSSTGGSIPANRLRRMKELEISEVYWQVGQSLLAMGDKDKAVELFRVVRDTDHMGKYRNLAEKQLDSLGNTNTAERALT